jgi:hypothetical protein
MSMKKVQILTITSLLLSFVSQTLFSDFASAKLKMNQSSLVITNTNFVSIVGTPIVLITSGGSGIRNVHYSTSNDGCAISGNLLSAQSATSCIVVATNPANGNYGSVTSSPKIFSFRNPSLLVQNALAISNALHDYAAGTDVLLTYTGGSGILDVKYSVNGMGCSISGNLLTAIVAGSCIVVATNPANGNYAIATSSPTSFNFTGKKPQAQLSITNSVFTGVYGNSGSPILLTSSGGSGTIAVSYSVRGLNCLLTGNSLSSNNVAYCVVTATNAANGDFAATASAPVAFKFLPASSSCMIYDSYNYPPMNVMWKISNGELIISWENPKLPSGVTITYNLQIGTYGSADYRYVNNILGTSYVTNNYPKGMFSILINSKLANESPTGCYYNGGVTVYVDN